MKRRDFLKGATSSAGLVYLKPVSAGIPCPPFLSGGSGAPLCPVAAGVEEDWQSRISGPGVVWYHNFANEAEVTQFRWGSITGGNDTLPGAGSGDGLTRHITSDGVTGGGCLEIAVPTGGTTNSSWARPFSPLTGATNGRGTDDPGADGTITTQAWDVGELGFPGSYDDYLGSWKHGTYTHSDYDDHARNAGQGYASDGDEFYLQFRVKMSASRGTAGNPDGKLAFITVCGDPTRPGGGSHITPDSEIVIQSLRNTVATVYTNKGGRWNSELNETQGDGSTNEMPGSDFTSCVSPNINSTNCGSYNLDEWMTVLVHVKPGHEWAGSQSFPNASNDTQFRMWIAGAGDTSYTTVFNKDDYVWDFGSAWPDEYPIGFSCFQPSAYMNRVDAVEGWYHRYDEIIFSKEFIPCPQV